eukprot:scaffold20920_cov67-Phaeocystis_antarctica.AAC.11
MICVMPWSVSSAARWNVSSDTSAGVQYHLAAGLTSLTGRVRRERSMSCASSSELLRDELGPELRVGSRARLGVRRRELSASSKANLL